MLVKCVKIYDASLNIETNQNHWLTVGKTYFVLEVLAREEFNEYRLLDDKDQACNPGVYRSWQFEVVDSRMPSNWEVNQETPNSLIIGPKPWQEPDFWERFYQRESKQEDLFNQEAKKMYKELGWADEKYRL